MEQQNEHNQAQATTEQASPQPQPVKKLFNKKVFLIMMAVFAGLIVLTVGISLIATMGRSRKPSNSNDLPVVSQADESGEDVTNIQATEAPVPEDLGISFFQLKANLRKHGEQSDNIFAQSTDFMNGFSVIGTDTKADGASRNYSMYSINLTGLYSILVAVDDDTQKVFNIALAGNAYELQPATYDFIRLIIAAVFGSDNRANTIIRKLGMEDNQIAPFQNIYGEVTEDSLRNFIWTKDSGYICSIHLIINSDSAVFSFDISRELSASSSNNVIER